MRSSQSLLLFSTLLLYLITLTSAWPWPIDKILPAVDSLIVRDAFLRRADSSTASKATPTPTGSSPAAAATSSGSSAAKTSSDASSASSSDGTSKDKSKPTESGASASGSAASGSAASGTGSDSNITETGDSKKSTSTHKKTSTTSISVPADAAAGGLEMLIPDTTSGSQFYKISDYVTFAWNYTSLLVTPTAVDILVTCTSNSQMYTIASNQTVSDNATGVVVWDTNNYPEMTSAPLLTAIYTLYIFDVDEGISATPEPGHMTVLNYAFGMYTKQAYTDFADWTCATCSAAMSADERRYLGFMFAMVGVTVLSFTWFVNGLGVVW